jgi:hypothetical protein
MKRINLLVPALLLLAVACKNKPKQTEGTVTAQDSLENKNYLPVADFIRNDIIRVDSFSGGIVRKVTIDGKKDSNYIQLPTFHQLANQFLLPELDSASFHTHFNESSLMDETTQMINFIYNGKQADWPLRNVMVYLKPSLTNDQVNRIYMEKEFMSGDTSVQQRFTWKLREFFYIITVKQPKNGPAVTTMDKVIWDPQFFAE